MVLSPLTLSRFARREAAFLQARFLARIRRTKHDSVKLIAKYTMNANPNSTNTSVTLIVPRLNRSTHVPLYVFALLMISFVQPISSTVTRLDM